MRRIKSKRRVSPRTLRFSPYSWAKLLYLRDRGDTEVGGFGICQGDDLLHVDDIALVQQSCTEVTVTFDDESVANFFDSQVDAGLRPEQFARIWIHTHPGASARPSGVDEETFLRVFGSSDWAVMFILAQEGESYARLQFNVGPRGSQKLRVEIDYSQPFTAAEWEHWDQEYLANVRAQGWNDSPIHEKATSVVTGDTPSSWRDAWHGYTDQEFQEMFAHEQP